ncbi:MAG: hypothetical protein HXY40_03095 [Chloroflexi bacterium]|nr:hypothetical protein [Chloroflexota bacterium]
MRNFGILVVVIALMLLGGGLTAQLAHTDFTQLLPIVRQTNVAEGSFISPAPWQAQQFMLLVGFILFNLVGIAATLALIMWLLDRQVRRAKASARAQNVVTPTSAPAKE